MDSQFFRKYVDIIEAAEQGRTVVQLDEGMMDMLKPLAAKFAKMIGADAMQDIAAQVKQVTGGDLTPSKENAIKVAQAFGLDKKPEAVAEGIAGNWQGKLRQLVYSSGVLGSLAGAASMWGTVGGSWAFVIGMILLMGVAAFFGDAPGQVGAMGKFGNKGTSTQKGLDDAGRIITNRGVD
jgi:hypothetical protein